MRQQIEIGVWKGLGTELDAVEVSIVRCCKVDLEIHFSPKIGKFSALSGLLKTLKFPCLLKEVSIGHYQDDLKESLDHRAQNLCFRREGSLRRNSGVQSGFSEEGTCKAKG